LQEESIPMILSTIGLGIGGYALGAGALSSAVMIARGGVRVLGRAYHGDFRGASLGLLGGVAAPAVSAAHQLAALGCEIAACAVSISTGSTGSEDVALPDDTFSERGLGRPSAASRRLDCASAAGALIAWPPRAPGGVAQLSSLAFFLSISKSCGLA
jgi:hypothetical protein